MYLRSNFLGSFSWSTDRASGGDLDCGLVLVGRSASMKMGTPSLASLRYFSRNLKKKRLNPYGYSNQGFFNALQIMSRIAAKPRTPMEVDAKVLNYFMVRTAVLFTLVSGGR